MKKLAYLKLYWNYILYFIYSLRSYIDMGIFSVLSINSAIGKTITTSFKVNIQDLNMGGAITTAFIWMNILIVIIAATLYNLVRIFFLKNTFNSIWGNKANYIVFYIFLYIVAILINKKLLSSYIKYFKKFDSLDKSSKLKYNLICFVFLSLILIFFICSVKFVLN